MTDDELTKIIIGCAYKVHNTLGAGFLEKLYKKALCIELEKAGLSVRVEAPISVLYDGQAIGEYFADLWVENRIIVELKAVQSLNRDHEVQLVNYLSATGTESGYCSTSVRPFKSGENIVCSNQLTCHPNQSCKSCKSCLCFSH